MRSPRSRSPLGAKAAPSAEAREAILADFARLYWSLPDEPEAAPWVGERAARIARYRLCLVNSVEREAQELDLDPDTGYTSVTKDTVVRWQRFTFFEDTARMTDVLFRGPIEPSHADAVDLRLHAAWRRLHATIRDFEEFNDLTAPYRVSAVCVAMMLETARPPEADLIDGYFDLPDARTLASLLSLRCEKDDVGELHEMYRLICHKLQGDCCTWCEKGFDESTSAGLFDGANTLVVPATVPKLFVPQCGHAIHTLCFGSQLLSENENGMRGRCRCCLLPYGWTAIDVDPMVLAFCLLFGTYVGRRAQEISAAGEVIREAIIAIAQVCQHFSMEMNGLVTPSSTWVMLTKRHLFDDPETVDAISEYVLEMLLPPPDAEPFPRLAQAAVFGPDDHSGDESQAEEDKHVMEVFLPDRGLSGSPLVGHCMPPPSPGDELGFGDDDGCLPPPLPEDSTF